MTSVPGCFPNFQRKTHCCAKSLRSMRVAHHRWSQRTEKYDFSIWSVLISNFATLGWWCFPPEKLLTLHWNKQTKSTFWRYFLFVFTVYYYKQIDSKNRQKTLWRHLEQQLHGIMRICIFTCLSSVHGAFEPKNFEKTRLGRIRQLWMPWIQQIISAKCGVLLMLPLIFPKMPEPGLTFQ